MDTSGTDRTGGGRARRVDAQANRGRILDVAEQVFGTGGESASTEEVARLAGVGIATVFRHFPTKAALLQAVLVRRFDRLREQAEALLNATDPGTAFFDFFRYLVTDAPTKIAIGDALLDAGGEYPSWNTRDFDLQTSNDSAAWTTRAQVRGNTADSTTTTVNVDARWVRLVVVTPANDGNTAARIYEMEVRG